ncbi:MAG TPA: alcohol dehydrogenase catalytic domain-containing protein [Actinomycetaceae bacterium]|nr:alcohol dehydrogenase catalytic domain-containing protein [Actinomycetaceae bacterium]
MRAVTYVRNNTIEIREKEIPELEPDQVLIRVQAAGVCLSDLAIIGLGDDNPLIGSTLGHETAGVIEKLGDTVSGWEVGEQVVVLPLLNCGQCRECAAGRDNLCLVAGSRDALTPMSYGVGVDGGMADYMVVYARHLVASGDLDPVVAASLTDAAWTPMHTINSVRDRTSADATVLVLGIGGLGHMGLQILAATSGARIIAADTDPDKVAFAAEHGADLAILSDENTAARVLEDTGGRGADVILDFIGVQPTVDTSLDCIAQGGAIRIAGLGGGTFTYRAENDERLPWGVNIERAYGGNRSDLSQVVALAQAGKIAVNAERYDLADVQQAFDDLAAGKIMGRAVLVP